MAGKVDQCGVGGEEMTMRCLRWLTRAVRGCPRQWQEVGGVALLAGLLRASLAWAQAYEFESLECFVPMGIADGQIGGSASFNGQACGLPLNFAARILDGLAVSPRYFPVILEIWNVLAGGPRAIFWGHL